MNLSPLITRELRAEMRSHRLRKERFVAGLITAFILAVLLLSERWSGVSIRRLLTLAPLAGVGPFFLLVIGLNRAGQLLSAERREGTLPLLLLTHMTGPDIVLGTLLTALLAELNLILATLPALVLPLIAVGFQFGELSMIALGCLNVLFFALALGLFGSVFGDGRVAASWCLLLLLPMLAYSTPFALLLPSGPIRQCLAAMQWLNPCDALAHVQMAAGRLRPSAYWSSLLTNHAFAWCLLGLAGFFLPRACRRQAGADAGPRPRKLWRPWNARNRSPVLRRRLLNRNPFLWLTSRERWPRVQVWLMLAISPAGWGWLAWLAWANRGLNITALLAVAAAVSWLVTLFVLVPAEASRRLVEDRNSGALEMILCTPLDVKEIVRGQWLSLGRRYLPPVIAVMILSTALMAAGYVTFGFGEMLDPEDRGLWLFFWLASILLSPFCLTALCWMAMRRALFARDVGEASGIALVQVIGLPVFALCGIHSLGRWAGWNPAWWETATLFTAAFVATQVAFAWRGRLVLLRDLRHAAAGRYSISSATESQLLIWVRWLLSRRTRSSPAEGQNTTVHPSF